MKTGRGILFLSVLACGIFFCSALFCRAATPVPDGTHITKSITWKKSESPYLIKGAVFVEAELTIEPGTVIKLANKKGILHLFNKINAVGTTNDRIIFTSDRDDAHGGDTNGDGNATQAAKGDWLGLNYGSPFSSGEMKYISVLYAGYNSSGDWGNAVVINNQDDVSLTRSEIMFTRGNGIMIVAECPTIEENIISNNNTGIIYYGSSKIPVLKNNSIFGNSTGVTVRNPVTGALMGHIDARDNWWGSDSGPTHKDNPSGKGDNISDNVFFDPWLGKDTNDGAPDPAILIPGIMGSWEKDGAWQIDPIFHTYDDLIEAFISAGYANDGKEMSVFPYEWRDSNIANAKLLHKRIQQIKADTGRPKVDIVAHSMGGLLARQYIESGDFENDVDQLITLGTPHLGAPKDYIKWEAGAFFSDIFELAGKKFFEHEAKENKYDSVFHYIQGRPMESVRELLPVYDYLYDDNGSDYNLRIGYPTNYPRNEFLENLNDAGKIQTLENVEFTKIIGKQNKESTTISGFNVINASMGKLWEHGYPHGFEIPKLGDQGIKKRDGDETVPTYSAEAEQIPDSKKIYLQSEHNALPTDAQQDILEILTGKRPSEKIDEWQIDNILIGQVFSPIDFQIVSPSGKRLGKNFETDEEINEIEGAYYSGFSTNTEFITIPNPEDGEYQIITEGTGTGEYEVEIAKITEDEETGETNESSQTITSEAIPEIQEEAKIEIDGNSVKKVEKLTISEPEKKTVAANQIYTEIRTEVSINASNNSPENNISTQDNQSRIQKLDFLKNDVRRYFKSGEIRKRKTAAEIEKKLAHIRVYLRRYETGTSLKKMKTAKMKASKDIVKLVQYVNKNTPKFITEEARSSLVEDINDLRID